MYSLSFKKKVLDFIDRNNAITDAVDKFGVSKATIYRWYKDYKKNNSIEVCDNDSRNEMDYSKFFFKNSTYKLILCITISIISIILLLFIIIQTVKWLLLFYSSVL
jgi:hypothetical protein